jgi:site-specific recombinase XerD
MQLSWQAQEDSMPSVQRGVSHTSTLPPVDSRSSTPSSRSTSNHHNHIQEPARVLRQYLLWHESEGHSRKTQSVYKRTLEPFFAYLKSEHQLEDLCELQLEHLRAWLVWLRNTDGQHGRPRSTKSIESYCRQAKAFLRWCVAEGVLEHDPTARLKLPKAEKKYIRVFSDEEIKQMHEACVPPSNGLRPDVRRMMAARNRAVLWVLLDTGMRASELRGMRFMDFDRKRGTIYIPCICKVMEYGIVIRHPWARQAGEPSVP